MAKTSRAKRLPDPDPRDVRVTCMEAEVRELRLALEQRTGELGEANRENGRLMEVAKQWKAEAERHSATINNLRDQCANAEYRLAELTGYAAATVETLERMEGAVSQPSVPAEPVRRQMPGRDVIYLGERSRSNGKPWWRV